MQESSEQEDAQVGFKRMFTTLFAQYSADGMNKSEAAAKAILEAQSAITHSCTTNTPNVSNATTPIHQTNSSVEKEETLESTSLPEPPAPIATQIAKKASLPPLPHQTPQPKSQEPELGVERVSALLDEGKSTGSYTSLIRAAGSFLRDDERLERAFCNNGNDVEKEQSSAEGKQTVEEIDFDIDAVRQVFELICSCPSEGAVNSVGHALDALGGAIQMRSHTYSTGKQCKLFFIVLEHPEIDSERFEVLMLKITNSMQKVPNIGKKLIIQWLRDKVTTERFQRYISLMHGVINRSVNKEAPEDARTAVRILALLHAAWSGVGNTSLVAVNKHIAVPVSSWYNDKLNVEYMQTRQGRSHEFRMWLYDRDTAEEKEDENATNNENLPLNCTMICRSYVSYPFILTAQTKSLVLEIDAMVQQRQEHDREIQGAQARGATSIASHRLYLVLRVRRDNLIVDTLSQIPFIEENDLKKELKVMFDEEDGVDAGGVRKEYYLLMMKELLNPSYGMFRYFEESRLLWFSSDCLEQPSEYEMIGVLVGVAIYNSIIVDLQMPTALYKKLKGDPVTLDDLKDLQPALAQGLQAMLEFDGDVAEVFGQTFELTYERYGEQVNVELKEGGGDIIVDNNNREEYVAAYVAYQLEVSVAPQFEAFKRGFHKVAGGIAMNMFSSAELELLICGGKILDFNDLKKGATYQDGYTENSTAVGMFWDVVLEFDENQKKSFLKFISGSDRCPIDGLSQLGLVISKNTDEDDRLPSAHTCFNHILLPEYSTLDIMKTRIIFAMEQTEGFGLR
jgi:hypothetical protein